MSVFNCVVYFVKTAHTMELLWGTTSPIQVRDKVLDIATKLRAHGAYKIQISDPGKFLTKLVGGNEKFMGQQELVDEIRRKYDEIGMENIGRLRTAQAPTQNPSPTPAPAEDPMETLSKLKKMLDGGLITQEAYDKKMNEVLARM